MKVSHLAMAVILAIVGSMEIFRRHHSPHADEHLLVKTVAAIDGASDNQQEAQTVVALDVVGDVHLNVRRVAANDVAADKQQVVHVFRPIGVAVDASLEVEFVVVLGEKVDDPLEVPMALANVAVDEKHSEVHMVVARG